MHFYAGQTKLIAVVIHLTMLHSEESFTIPTVIIQFRQLVLAPASIETEVQALSVSIDSLVLTYHWVSTDVRYQMTEIVDKTFLSILVSQSTIRTNICCLMQYRCACLHPFSLSVQNGSQSCPTTAPTPQLTTCPPTSPPPTCPPCDDCRPTPPPSPCPTPTMCPPPSSQGTRRCQHVIAIDEVYLICAGLKLMLGGQTYPNNSVFLMTDIGEASLALLCVTNHTDCCQSNRMGEWFYPDNTQVPIKSAGLNFYRDRGSQVVRLNRRNNALSPTGKYRCEIVDASGTSQTLIANIIGRPIVNNKGNCMHVQLLSPPHAFLHQYVCTSPESPSNEPPISTCPPSSGTSPGIGALHDIA